jgi:hypothetical protein
MGYEPDVENEDFELEEAESPFGRPRPRARRPPPGLEPRLPSQTRARRSRGRPPSKADQLRWSLRASFPLVFFGAGCLVVAIFLRGTAIEAGRIGIWILFLALGIVGLSGGALFVFGEPDSVDEDSQDDRESSGRRYVRVPRDAWDRRGERQPRGREELRQSPRSERSWAQESAPGGGDRRSHPVESVAEPTPQRSPVRARPPPALLILPYLGPPSQPVSGPEEGKADSAEVVVLPPSAQDREGLPSRAPPPAGPLSPPSRPESPRVQLPLEPPYDEILQELDRLMGAMRARAPHPREGEAPENGPALSAEGAIPERPRAAERNLPVRPDVRPVTGPTVGPTVARLTGPGSDRSIAPVASAGSLEGDAPAVGARARSSPRIPPTIVSTPNGFSKTRPLAPPPRACVGCGTPLLAPAKPVLCRSCHEPLCSDCRNRALAEGVPGLCPACALLESVHSSGRGSPRWPA